MRERDRAERLLKMDIISDSRRSEEERVKALKADEKKLKKKRKHIEEVINLMGELLEETARGERDNEEDNE